MNSMKFIINNFSSKKINIIIYILFIIVSFLLPFFSFSGYSIIKNTTSHLGAQGSPYAFLMNLTFILLGLSTLFIMIETKIRFLQLLGLIFSISLIGTGIFRHEALIDQYQSNMLEENLHSVFATSTGISFVILSLGHALMSKGKQRYAAFLLFFIASFISLGMAMFSQYMGILQRLMFLSSFFWIFFYMKPPIDKKYQSERNKYEVHSK